MSKPIHEHMFDPKQPTGHCIYCNRETTRRCVSCRDRPYVCADCYDKHAQERPA